MGDNSLPKYHNDLNGLLMNRRSRRKAGAAHGTESHGRQFVRYMFFAIVLILLVGAIGIRTTTWDVKSFSPHVASFLLSLSSMVGVWAASSRRTQVLLSGGLTGFILLGWTIIAEFEQIGFDHQDTPVGWAICLCAQVILTVIGVLTFDTFSKSSRRNRSHREAHGARLRKFSFSIANVIIWTTCVAFALVTFQIGLIAIGRQDASISVAGAAFAGFLGISGAVQAVSAVAIFRGATWSALPARFFIVLPVFVAVAVIVYLATAYAASGLSVDPLHAGLPMLEQACFNLLILLATLNHTRR